MYFAGLGLATPATRYTKAECWEAFRRSEWFERLDPRTRAVARAVLLGDNGMESRRLALASLEEVFQIDPDTLHRRFLANAPSLAERAGAAALEDAKLTVQDIDAVVVSTCTGYLCPGISSYLIERLALPTDTPAYDLVGQGCAAALPNMRLAHALLACGECRHVLSVCVEVSSAAMYLDDDLGVMVSACLFGDGAAAAVLSASPAQIGRRRMVWRDSESLLDATRRQELMFDQRGGMLRNVLTRAVPALAAENAERVLEALLARARLERSDIRAWILHAGGRDVLRALEERLRLDRGELRYSAAVLREYGNLSSAFVYFVLRAALDDGAPGGWWWLGSFGAGFSSQAAILEVD